MRPTEKIENAVKKMNFTAGAELREQILNDALKAHERTGKQPALEKPTNIWRTIVKSRITKLSAAAAAIIIIGVIGVQFLTGMSAYAKAAEGLRNASTFVFTLITQANNGTGETIKTDIAYKSSGFMRTSTIDGYVTIVNLNSGKFISIRPQGIYTLCEIDTNDLNAIYKNGHPILRIIEDMKNLPEKADEELSRRDIDGIDCDGYKVTQGDLTSIVWIDAKTGDVVQVEQKYAIAPGMNRIIKNIKFDIELDDSLFSLTPPAGFIATGELKSDGTGETEETFIKWLRWWAESNTDETFPPKVTGSDVAKICIDLGKQGKLREEAWGKNVDSEQWLKSALFVAKLPAESNWRYAGDGVKINTPDTPVFWYRPAGTEKYRVIYADLTVREVAEDELPR
jgi:outer membrane lipoprotein-sorting protein